GPLARRARGLGCAESRDGGVWVMKLWKSLMLAAGVFALAGGAMAAEVVRPPVVVVKPVAPKPFTWGGAYIGAQGGWDSTAIRSGPLARRARGLGCAESRDGGVWVMKLWKSLMLAAGVFALAGGAMAAEVVRPPVVVVKPVAPKPFTWGGAYIGAQGGWDSTAI